MDRIKNLTPRQIIVIVLAVMLLGVVSVGAAGGYLYWSRLQEHQEWYNYGMQAYEEEDYIAAYRVLQRWLVQHPDDVDTLRVYADAVSRITEDRVDHLRKAATAYNQILRTDPGDRTAHENLCELYRRVEMWGNLLTYTESELLREPDDLMFQFYRAVALHEIGRLDTALEAYREQIERDTPYFEVYLNAARIVMDRGFVTQAEEILQRGVNAHPESATMRLQVAHFYSINKMPDRANAAFEAAFALESDSAEVWVAQARHLNLQKRYAEAADAAQRAIELDPESGSAYGQLVLSYERLGRVDEAIALIDGLDPLLRADHSTLLLSLAEMHLSEGNVDGMEAAVEEYMIAYPSHRVIADYFRARRMLVEGDPAAAASLLSLVHEEASTFAPAHFFLAVAYREAGNRTMARATLDGYRRNYPDDERARIIEVRDFQAQSRSIGEARVNAQTILGDVFSDIETLLASGVSLFDAARRENRLDAEMPLVRALIDAAIDKRPTDQRPYRAMADMYIVARNIDAANTILDQALAAGVPPEDLAITRANLALAHTGADDARAILEQDLTRPDIDADRVLRWSSFFRARNESQLALAAISLGREQVSEADRAQLDAELVGALARAGELESAKEALAELAANADAIGLISARLEVARALLELESPDATAEASQLIALAAADRPEDPLVLVLQAEERMRRVPADYDGALEVLEFARQQNPDDIRVLAGLSTVAEARGDTAGALAYAQQASDKAPNLVSVQVRTAELLLQLGRFPDAIDQADRILATAPNEPNAMGIRAAALLGNGQLARAREVLASIEQIHGDDPTVQPMLRALRNRVLTAGGEGEQVLAMLRAAHEREPDSLPVTEELAQKLSQLGQGGEAINLLRGFVERNQADAAGWVALSRAQLALNSPDSLDRASESLTRALVISPRDADALRQLIEVHMRRGNLNEALALCDRFLELRPNQPEVMYQKARILAARPEGRENALAIISEALAVADQPEYRGLRGTLYLDQGEFDLARVDFQVVANAQPVTTAMLDLALAEAHVGLRDFASARPYYQSAQRKREAGQVIDAERLERVGTEIEQGVGT